MAPRRVGNQFSRGDLWEPAASRGAWNLSALAHGPRPAHCRAKIWILQGENSIMSLRSFAEATAARRGCKGSPLRITGR